MEAGRDVHEEAVVRPGPGRTANGWSCPLAAGVRRWCVPPATTPGHPPPRLISGFLTPRLAHHRRAKPRTRPAAARPRERQARSRGARAARAAAAPWPPGCRRRASSRSGQEGKDPSRTVSALRPSRALGLSGWPGLEPRLRPLRAQHLSRQPASQLRPAGSPGAGLRPSRAVLPGVRPPGEPCYILVLPKSSNSPLCTPARKACHSSGVNRRTGPSRSRLFLTPTVPPGRSETSTQLPLA